MRSSTWMILVMLAGCVGGSEDDSGGTGGGSSGGSSGGGSGGSSGGDDSDGPCGEDGLCDVVVSEVGADCGEDAGGVATLRAAVEGAGEVRIQLIDAEAGCCPTVEATAEADMSKGEIRFTYAFTADECDCACYPDLSLLVSEVPAGPWTVVYGVQSVPLTVE